MYNQNQNFFIKTPFKGLDSEQQIKTTIREQIVIEAEKWITTPFRYRGYTKDGCDCIGLLIGIMKSLNAPKEIISTYINHRGIASKYIDPDIILSTFERFWEEVNLDQILTGDILLLSLSHTKHTTSHIAIISSIDPPYIIHSHREIGEVQKIILDDYWLKKIFKVFRYSSKNT